MLRPRIILSKCLRKNIHNIVLCISSYILVEFIFPPILNWLHLPKQTHLLTVVSSFILQFTINTFWWHWNKISLKIGFNPGLKDPDSLDHTIILMVSSLHLKCASDTHYTTDCVELDANEIRKNKMDPQILFELQKVDICKYENVDDRRGELCANNPNIQGAKAGVSWAGV